MPLRSAPRLFPSLSGLETARIRGPLSRTRTRERPAYRVPRPPISARSATLRPGMPFPFGNPLEPVALASARARTAPILASYWELTDRATVTAPPSPVILFASPGEPGPPRGNLPPANPFSALRATLSASKPRPFERERKRTRHQRSSETSTAFRMDYESKRGFSSCN